MNINHDSPTALALAIGPDVRPQRIEHARDRWGRLVPFEWCRFVREDTYPHRGAVVRFDRVIGSGSSWHDAYTDAMRETCQADVRTVGGRA